MKRLINTLWLSIKSDPHLKKKNFFYLTIQSAYKSRNMDITLKILALILGAQLAQTGLLPNSEESNTEFQYKERTIG